MPEHITETLMLAELAEPPFHSHDRPRCITCGDGRGPWRPTGDHCEHGVQTFRCLPCAEAVAQ